MNFSSRFVSQKSKSDILDSKHKISTHGKEMWNVLHITSVFLPEKPNTEEIDHFTNFVNGILIFGTKFDSNWNDLTLKYIKDNPFNFSTRENSMLWVCNFHNFVNEKTEKDLFECTKEKIAKRWGNYSVVMNSVENIDNIEKNSKVSL